MNTRRCAIYTRKSSEEGLEQEFNSLHAQREACEAYIKSQTHEGWKLVRKHYDDGGFSGGNIERPGLQKLLDDIAAGDVDVVVVYKVDRLTRSLTDFAKIVDVFDKAEVSFVAVTQHFNTTSSMGRLTLNVLLSFAQFEREVTGERIRDKIAASKRKGMWMGGVPPLGYCVKDRKLIVVEDEATTVRLIFGRYAELGSVTLLRADLRRRNVRSKRWCSAKGNTYGGNHFARGALYRILRNKLYRGQIEYKENTYEGEHQSIVPKELWDRAQEVLTKNRRRHAMTDKNREPYLLEGLIFDDQGHPMSPSYSQKSSGRRYRYYVSSPLIRKERCRVGTVPRIPAKAIEDLVLDRLRSLEAIDNQDVLTRDQLKKYVERLTVADDNVELLLSTRCLEKGTNRHYLHDDEISMVGDSMLVRIVGKLKRRGGEKIIVGPEGKALSFVAAPDRKLIRNIVQAHVWRTALESGERKSIQEVAEAAECMESYVRKLLPLAYLAPDITEALLDGRQPPSLELQHLTNRKLPLEWAAQRKQLGFTA